MAEFLNQAKPEPLSGFAAMGKPISTTRRSEALKHVRQMGIEDRGEAWTLVASVANKLERDEPYEALRAAMAYLDLTGAYRLMAVLLTGPDE